MSLKRFDGSAEKSYQLKESKPLFRDWKDRFFYWLLGTNEKEILRIYPNKLLNTLRHQSTKPETWDIYPKFFHVDLFSSTQSLWVTLKCVPDDCEGLRLQLGFFKSRIHTLWTIVGLYTCTLENIKKVQ